MNLRFPIRNRIALTLATLALIVLIGITALSELALSPDNDAETHSLVYISDCPGTVTEERSQEQVIATVTTTEERTNLAYNLKIVSGTADRSDFGYKEGLFLSSNPAHPHTRIVNDDHLDDGETFMVTVGSSSDDVGLNDDQRCNITIRDNDPPRAREMRLGSDPADGDTYRRGEKIEIEVEFDNKVRVVGDPAVPLWLGVSSNGNPWVRPTDPSDIKQAAYARGTDTKVLTFAYEVSAGDWDSDGLVVPSLDRTGLGRRTVKWAFGDRYADHTTDRWLHGPKVNGR